MARLKLGPIAQACVLLGTLALSNGAMADGSTEADVLKQSLELEKLKLGVEKDRADLYKSLVPDLSAFKREAPKTAPEVAGTTTRLTYIQATSLANEVAKQVRAHVPAANSGQTKTGLVRSDGKTELRSNMVILESPHLLGYLSSLSSVEELLASNTTSVTTLTKNLDEMVKKPLPPTEAGKTSKAVGSFAAVLPVIQLGFAIASAVRPNYVMGGTRHEELSTKVLRAQVVSILACPRPIDERKDANGCAPTEKAQHIDVYDADSAIKWPAIPEEALDKKVEALREAIKKARVSLNNANAHVSEVTEAAKPASPEGKPEPKLTERATTIAAQAKNLTTDVDNAAKYLVSLHTATDSGLIPLIAAKRGLWLREKLSDDPPRLTLSSAVAATDIIASDGFFSGLKVSVAGNTIVEWRLVFSDGRVRTGMAQSCADPTVDECKPLLLKASDLVRWPKPRAPDLTPAAGG